MRKRTLTISLLQKIDYWSDQIPKDSGAGHAEMTAYSFHTLFALHALNTQGECQIFVSQLLMYSCIFFSNLKWLFHFYSFLFKSSISTCSTSHVSFGVCVCVCYSGLLQMKTLGKAREAASPLTVTGSDLGKTGLSLSSASWEEEACPGIPSGPRAHCETLWSRSFLPTGHPGSSPVPDLCLTRTWIWKVSNLNDAARSQKEELAFHICKQFSILQKRETRIYLWGSLFWKTRKRLITDL